MTYRERILTKLADTMYDEGFTAIICEEYGQGVSRLPLKRNEFIEHMLGIDCEYVWWNHESLEDRTVGVWSLIIPMNDEDMVSDWTDDERFDKAYELFRSRI